MKQPCNEVEQTSTNPKSSSNIKRGNFTMVSNQVIQSPYLNADEKIMYIILKSYNPSFPSNAKLMELTGWGKNKVIYVKQRLQKENIITSKRRRNSSNLYEVKKFEEIREFTDSDDQQFTDNDTNKNNIKLIAGNSNNITTDSLSNKLYKSTINNDSLVSKPLEYDTDNIYELSDYDEEYIIPVSQSKLNSIFASSHKANSLSNANVIHG
jgi:hypothetical protein